MRNGSGTYTLPVAPFVPNTAILSAEVNEDFDDIADALTGSIASDGQTPITGSLQGFIGSAAAPSYSWAVEPDSGFYWVSPGIIGLAIGGADAVTFEGLNVTFAGTITVTGGFAGPLTFGGAITFESTILVEGIATFSATSYMQLPSGTTAQRTADVVAGQFRYNSTLSQIEYYAAAWTPVPVNQTQLQALVTPRTTQVFTTAGAGTYTVPTPAPAYLYIRMVGGGGGGSGNGTTTTGNDGTDGTASVFNSIAANPGLKATKNSGTTPGNGGAGGSSGSGTAVVRIPGQSGGYGDSNAVRVGASGGMSFFGGAGVGRYLIAGGNAAANTGGGGGGAGNNGGALTNGCGGGGGEYAEYQINGPTAAATYSYTVGAKGTGGAAGTGGFAGGDGGAGIIIVEEYYI